MEKVVETDTEPTGRRKSPGAIATDMMTATNMMPAPDMMPETDVELTCGGKKLGNNASNQHNAHDRCNPRNH